jgi:3-phenylpropionate/trans-cinnamate dioxygenase ferredoxin reductase component
VSSPSSVLVVGAGAAGAQALLALRRLGYENRIDLVGAEGLAPYERPPLSKDVLVCDGDAEPAWLLDSATLSDVGVNSRLAHAVESIDMTDRCALLTGAEQVGFDRLLLATGAAPRPLCVPGADLKGVFYLRTMDDARRIRHVLWKRQPLVVIGGGFIGLEVAAAAATLGCAVTVVEAGSQLMGRAVPPPISDIFAEEHRRRGVAVELCRRPLRLMGKYTIEAVLLDDGRVLPAAAVVIGIGVIPEVSLGTLIGAKTDDGIVVDTDGRTSVEGVFAAGDCCRVRSDAGRGVRLEAWQNALDQGTRAAHAMLGCNQPPLSCPWMWSDQYDYQLQVVGAPTQVDHVVARGDNARAELICFQLCGGRLVGAIGVNRSRDVAIVRRVVATAPAVDPTSLADEQWSLRHLLQGLPAAVPMT